MSAFESHAHFACVSQLYGINDGGKSFTPIGVAIRFYYFIAPNNDVDPVVQFPDGLRILSGNPNSKTPNPNNYAYVCQVGQTSRDQDVTRSDFNFDVPCPRVSDGFRSRSPRHRSCRSSNLVLFLGIDIGDQEQPLHAQLLERKGPLVARRRPHVVHRLRRLSRRFLPLESSHQASQYHVGVSVPCPSDEPDV
jgi:hypothetical protein